MTILDRYICKEILRNLSIVIVLVVTVYLTADFFEKIDNFMGAGLPGEKIISFFVLNLPFVIIQVLPVAVLLGVLISIGLMNKHVEVIALKSCGIGVASLLKPVMLIGVLFTIGLFLLSETIVPVTTARANAIWNRDVRKETLVRTREQNIWIRDDRSIIHIQHYIPDSRMLSGITINIFDDGFHLVRRLDARIGKLENPRLEMQDILEQRYDPKEQSYRIFHHDRLSIEVGFTLDRLKEVVREASEMSFRELYAYIDIIEKEGYPATSYRVDLQSKVAFPFVCIIMSIAGLGISLRKEVREGLPIGVVYGIIIAFFYWVLNSFCTSLAYGGMLPPFVAAWIANIVFGCAGGITLINADS